MRLGTFPVRCCLTGEREIVTFFALVLRNLLRQPLRAGLTILGISVGITTVVALGVITGSVRSSAAQVVQAGNADFVLSQTGSPNPLFSAIPEQVRQAIESRPDVDWTTAVATAVVPVLNNAFTVVVGIDYQEFQENPPNLIEGTLPDPAAFDQVIIGDRAASTLQVGVGDTVPIGEQPFHVVGIYHTGDSLQDGGLFAPVSVVQGISRRQGYVTLIYVKAAPGVDPDDLAADIERQIPEVTAVTNVSEFGQLGEGLEIIDAANLAISVLAVGVGAIGVMNTMVMSVSERTREFGILRAVGWTGGRILRMILIEALLLCLVAAVFGTILGFVATRAVLLIGNIRNYLVPEYTSDVFVRALVVAVAVALIGAIYPAVRAVRLTPMEALRYE